MIDCTKCKNWDVFDIRLTRVTRIYKGGCIAGWNEEEEWEHVETCAKGLSEIDNGKTVASIVGECKSYDPIGETGRQVDRVREQIFCYKEGGAR